MKQRFMLLGILSALILGSALPAYALSDAIEDAQYPPPLEQYNAGVALYEIQCNEPRDLYVTGSNTPVCLYPDTYQLLLERGVSLSMPPTPESIVRGVIDETIALYNSDPDGAFATITAMMLTDPSYPFVIDLDTIIVAHGSNPDRVGVSSVLIASTNKPTDVIISELQEGEVWVEYTFNNPATGTEQNKRSLIMLHDGYIFGSGYYVASDDAMTDKMTDDAMTDKMTDDAMTDKMTDDAMTDKMTDDAMTDAMSSLELTAEETAWLEENSTIRVAFDPGWLPIEYADEEGNLSGVTLQYAAEFSRLTGADFAGVPAAASWSDALAMMQNGEADAMYMIASTPERLEYLSFTTPHYTVETSIVTSNDRKTTLEDENISLITIEGYAIEAWLDENHPDVTYTSVANFAEGLELMKTGEEYAFAATWPVIVTHAETAGIDVYNAGPTGHQYDLNVGYSNEHPILGSILQKVVEAIPASQVAQWWNDAVPGDAMTDKMTDDAMTDAMSSLELTAEETAWLEENSTIRVAFDPGWLPIEYADEEGNLSGVTLQYAAEFSRLTGADFAGVPAADSWNDALAMMQNGEADVMYMIVSTPERLEYMSFTTTHYTVETSIVTSNDRQATLEDEDLILVIIEGYATQVWLDENHPDVTYTSVANFAEGLELMKTGEEYAFAATWPVIVTHAETAGIDVYNAGPTGYQYDLNVGYSNEHPILGSILQKVVDAIPASQVEQWWNDAVQ